MKKNALIGGVLILIGAILFLVTMFQIDFDFMALSNRPPYTASQYELETDSNIVIDAQSFDVQFQYTTDDTIQIVYPERENETFLFTESHGTLFVAHEHTYEWQDHIGVFDFHTGDMIVALPTDYVGTITVHADEVDVNQVMLQPDVETCFSITMDYDNFVLEFAQAQ